MRRRIAVSISFLIALAPPAASALQPLATFQAGAKTASVDVREAEQRGRGKDEEASASKWKLAPVFIATAGYTRNQYEAKSVTPVKTATFQPYDQLDAVLRVEIPLIDVGAWQRTSQTSAAADAERARVAATESDVRVSVSRAYHSTLAAESLLSAANKAVAAAEESASVIESRFRAGLATELDRKRAQAEIAARKQSLADVDLALITARRNLRTVSGIEPSAGGDLGEVPLDDEASLSSFEERAPTVPSVKAAQADARAAAETTALTKAALYPSVTGFGQERFTNAAGFGRSPQWAVGVTASWRVDLGTLPLARAATASEALARVREERATTTVRDQIHVAWHSVRASIAKSKAARAQRDASNAALAIARDRFAAGTGTSLDVVIAERDAFSADVNRIQADADLAHARVSLRVLAGVEGLR